jgi:predicted ThiF/HesA family dinucleotide-utilizing enzyme
MSLRLISRSPDLQRLLDDGYDVVVQQGHLLVRSVPYVAPGGTVKRGTLVSTLALAGDVTTVPDTHVVMFAGETPCDSAGAPLTKLINSSGTQTLGDGLIVEHTFSSKPPAGYADYFDKITTYIAILVSHAQVLDQSATARTYPVTVAAEEESIFEYIDSASTRAGIALITAKLDGRVVAIIGVGGTGAYVLDLVAKTPVARIDVFDGDRFLQHNAFRAPGAPSAERLRSSPMKASYFAEIYRNMHRGVRAHDYYVDDSNVHELRESEFVFIAIDDGPAKQAIVEQLTAWGVSFIDVGIGVYEVDGRLAGSARTTVSTASQHDHISRRLSFAHGDGGNEYAKNIQIADLNALNAALAVIKWKKLCGFYNDLELEHFSTYDIDGNTIINDDRR